MTSVANLELNDFISLIPQLSQNGKQELLVFIQNLINREKQEIEQEKIDMEKARKQLRELAGSIKTNISFSNEELEEEIRKAHLACRNYSYRQQ